MGLGSVPIGEAHVSLRATLDAYERDLARARAATERASRDMAVSLGKVEKSVHNLDQTSKRSSLGIQRLSREFLVLRAAVIGVSSVIGARQIAQAADAWVLMNTRLRLVSGSAEEAGATLERLFGIAQRARSDLETTVDFFFRLSNASAELGVNQQQVIQITETLQKLFKVGGVDAVRAAQATTQLTQAFTKQRLQGDELRTIHEAFPPLLNLIAREMGTTAQALANVEGGIAVRDLLSALLKGGADIERQFGLIPVTIGDALTQIKNSLTRAVGITATTTGAFKQTTAALQEMNDAINTPEFREGLGFIVQMFAEIAAAAVNVVSAMGIVVNFIDKLDEKIGWSLEKFITTLTSREETKKIFDEITAELVEDMKQAAIAANQAQGAVGMSGEGLGAGIAPAAEEASEAVDTLADDLTRLRNQASIAALSAYQFAGALDMVRTAFRGQDIGNIAPESTVNAMQKLADAGHDVTLSFSEWSPVVQQAFRDLVTEEEALRRVTVQVEAQADKLRELKDAHLEYQASRSGAAVDQAIEEGRQAEQAAEATRQRIEQGGQLPDTIGVANMAASELATTLSDLSNLSFDSLSEAFIQIAQQLAQMILQALLFRAIMAGSGYIGAAPTGTVAGAHGLVFQSGNIRRMARGGVVNRPTIIPMATGAALIGEAGPEAVVPLKRMASGDLGVRMEGGSGGGSVINIDARQSTPGTTAAAVREAVRLAPRAMVNAQARGMVGRGRTAF